jgi:hypothetical protein
MPNWIKLTSEEKRTQISEILNRLANLYPIVDDEDYQVFLHCRDAVKENIFDERHFSKLLEIPNGKLYYIVMREIALHGYDQSVLDRFEKEHQIV